MNKNNQSFTRTMLSIAIPVTLQNLLFSSFTLVDTLMIGRLGDLPLAAVGMAGKWTWFYGIVLFGFTSGAAVFINNITGVLTVRNGLFYYENSFWVVIAAVAAVLIEVVAVTGKRR